MGLWGVTGGYGVPVCHSGTLWVSMGSLWVHMGLYGSMGCKGGAMGFLGSFYEVPMGSLWVSMGPSGSLWVPMGSLDS